MAILNLTTQAQVYTDSVSSSNPLQRIFDWTRKLVGISVSRPSSRQYFLDPASTLTIFNGTRTTAIDGTTQFTLTVSPLASNRYRLTNTLGTSPAFRTARAINMTGNLLTITALANGALQVSLGAGLLAGTDFSLVQAGDNVWIPGVTTGDTAGPFNSANEGVWYVLGITPSGAVANRVLTLRRINSADPVGTSENQTPANANQFQAFSSIGVQSGDNVEFASTLWSPGLRKNFIVDRATVNWFEFLATDILPLDAGIAPTATGLILYTDAKRYVRVEADQECAIQFNGDTGQLVRVAPLIPADPTNVGFLEKWGPTWQLAIVNRTSAQLTLNVFAAD